MQALKLNGAESARIVRTPNLDPIPFPRGLNSAAPAAPAAHRAEDAFERVQRRLDNLRNALGPDYARADDGPWAA